MSYRFAMASLFVRLVPVSCLATLLMLVSPAGRHRMPSNLPRHWGHFGHSLYLTAAATGAPYASLPGGERLSRASGTAKCFGGPWDGSAVVTHSRRCVSLRSLFGPGHLSGSVSRFEPLSLWCLGALVGVSWLCLLAFGIRLPRGSAGVASRFLRHRGSRFQAS